MNPKQPVNRFTSTPTWTTSVAKTLRGDLDMLSQLAESRQRQHNVLIDAHMQDYLATMATQRTHRCYLRALLSEFVRYQRAHTQSEATIVRTFASIAAELDEMMNDEDADKYAQALKLLSKAHLFEISETKSGDNVW